MVPMEVISQDDKIIMKSSIATLRDKFFEMMAQINELLVVFDKIPNIQKDFSAALKMVRNTFSKLYKFLGIAISNCEELENLFM